jgi:hypothetical protein
VTDTGFPLPAYCKSVSLEEWDGKLSDPSPKFDQLAAKICAV